MRPYLAPWEWDLKRLAASVVVAGRQIRLSESDTARAVAATVRMSYREHMADYGGMPALDVWYDAIDIDPFTREIEKESEEVVKRIEQRLRKVREKNVPEFLFPKLVEHAWIHATHHGRSAADLSSDGRAASRPGDGLQGGDCALSRVAGQAHPRAVRPVSNFATWPSRWSAVGSVGTLCMHRALHGLGRRSDLPAGQGSECIRAGALRWQERACRTMASGLWSASA